MHLITGATGNVGSRIVERLLDQGDRPRLFVRDAQKARARYGDRVEIAIGDLADANSLKAALGGIDTLFLMNAGPGLEARDAAAAAVAKASGVERLVKLSSMDATQNIGTGVWHARGEAAIRAAGLAFVFVQPGGFMSNALGWAPSIKTEGIVRAPTGEGRIAFIHPDDIADVAAGALTSPAYDGASLPITGPEALSYTEMIAKIAAAVGRPLRFEPISDDEACQRMSASGAELAEIEAHLSIWRAIRDGRLAAVTDTVERVLGRKPKTFDRWVEENADAFR